MMLWQKIEVRGMLGVRRIRALVYREWAVHRCLDDRDRFVITLLPFGQCLPTDWCWFKDVSAAIAAMMEIARLRNDWHRIEQTDLTERLKRRLQAIVRRHGGCSDGPVSLVRDAGRRRFNGYAVPT